MDNSRIAGLLSAEGMPRRWDIVKTVTLLAFPAIIEQIMLTMVQYVDTAMVGSLGSSATAAVGLTSSTTWLFNGIFSAASVGFSVQVAQHLGAGRNSEAKSVTGQALKFVALFGLIIGAIAVALSFPLPGMLGADTSIRSDASVYFRIISCAMPFTLGANMLSAIIRCSGDTRTPMILNVLINIINMCLNFLFIYPSRQLEIFGLEINMWGAGMGVSGAAFASACSTTVVFVLFLLVLFFKKSPIRISLREGSPFTKECLGTVWKLGLPVALERVTITAAQILITSIITGIGTVAVAANHLAVTAEAVSYLPAYGVAVAATTLVGQAIGAGRKDLAKRFARSITWTGIIIMSFGGLTLFFFAPGLIGIFSSETQVIIEGAQVLKIVAFAEPLFGASIVAAGALRGAGDSKSTFIIGLTTMWGVRIVFSYLLAGSLGLSGVWVAMALELMTRGIIFMIRLYRGKWMDINIFERKKA